MTALFELCEGWENCDNEDLKNLFESKILEGEKFKLPDKEELDKLNEICSKCNYLLKIEERKCPVCGSENLQESPLITFHKEQKKPLPLTSFESGSGTQYFYRCENKTCRRLLYSHEQL